MHLPLCCVPYSGLGSCSQRARVRGAEDLCHVRLLLSVSSRHRSRLAFLPTVSGCGSGSISSASSVPRPLRVSSQKEPMTVNDCKLMIITTVSGAWL